MGPTERIERALDRLTTVGWCQGNYVKYDGWQLVGMCAVGALAYEPGDLWETRNDEVDAAVTIVEETLRLSSLGHGPLLRWNDHPDREAHEVIGAFALAAEVSRKREFAEELVPA